MSSVKTSYGSVLLVSCLVLVMTLISQSWSEFNQAYAIITSQVSGNSQLAQVGGGNVIKANSASYADVNDAVLNAQNGDTVEVPAGESTWPSYLRLTKGIKLIGAGSDKTIINMAACYNGGIEYVPVNPAANIPLRISGFTFNQTKSGCHNISLYQASGSAVIQTKIRIDHNVFINLNGQGLYMSPGFYGVVDNNSFNNIPYPIRMPYSSDGGKIAWNNWAGIEFGAADNNMYFEDNIFNGVSKGIISDCQFGGRYAFRYNTMNVPAQSFPLWDMHGNSGEQGYGCFGGEVYGNQITNSYYGTLFQQRGGKALWYFNNITSGGSWSAQVREEYATHPGLKEDVNDSYYFNNRKNNSGSLLNVSDVVGKGTASGGGNNYIEDADKVLNFCTIKFPDGCDTIGIRIVAGTGAGQCRQVLDIPSSHRANVVLNWDVIPDNTSQYQILINPCGIVENRDWFQQAVTFDGTTGVGLGPLSARPLTCTTGVGYWATDQGTTDLSGMVGPHPAQPISGTLYKCTSPNTWTSYYTPFTYPHPIRTDCASYPTLCDSSAFIPPPPIIPVSGLCSSTPNACSSGTLSDQTDTATTYLWSCQGSGGGSTASCSSPIPPGETPMPVVTPTPTLTPTPSTSSGPSAPGLSSTNISNITTTGASISWTTPNLSIGWIEYGLTTSYGNTTPPSTFYDKYRLVTLTNLLPNTIYHYRIRSRDYLSVNVLDSADQTFTTLSDKPVVIVPLIQPVSKPVTQPIAQNPLSTFKPPVYSKPGSKPAPVFSTTAIEYQDLTPTVPSWMDVILNFFETIVSAMVRGAGYTWESVRGVVR